MEDFPRLRRIGWAKLSAGDLASYLRRMSEKKNQGILAGVMQISEYGPLARVRRGLHQPHEIAPFRLERPISHSKGRNALPPGTNPTRPTCGVVASGNS